MLGYRWGKLSENNGSCNKSSWLVGLLEFLSYIILAGYLVLNTFDCSVERRKCIRLRPEGDGRFVSFSKKEPGANDFLCVLIHLLEFSNVSNNNSSCNATQSNVSI